jgi:hypothetical protein
MLGKDSSTVYDDKSSAEQGQTAVRGRLLERATHFNYFWFGNVNNKLSLYSRFSTKVGCVTDICSISIWHEVIFP